MKLSTEQEPMLTNLFELNARLESHEVQCEERNKTIFNRLEAIEKRLDDLNGLLTKLAVILITGMGGVVITSLMRG
jgi:hypothetical protein|tara:strand:+ start:744 stop:971 length:228 start_codon:yes stop_codon:yes gene_type:complete